MLMHAAFTAGCGLIHRAGRRIAPAVQPFPQENSMKRFLSLLLLAMFSVGSLSACNTMAGAGRDVQKVGEKVEEKAVDCKDGKC